MNYRTFLDLYWVWVVVVLLSLIMLSIGLGYHIINPGTSTAMASPMITGTVVYPDPTEEIVTAYPTIEATETIEPVETYIIETPIVIPVTPNQTVVRPTSTISQEPTITEVIPILPTVKPDKDDELIMGRVVCIWKWLYIGEYKIKVLINCR